MPAEIPSTPDERVTRTTLQTSLSPLRPAPAHHRLAWQTAAALVTLVVYAVCVHFAGTQTGARSGTPPIYAWLKFPPHHAWVQIIRWFVPVPLFFGWRFLAKTHWFQTLHDRKLLFLLPVVVFVMNIAVACVDGGLKELQRPFDFPGMEFYHEVRFVTGIRPFLHDFVSLHNALALHARTHPPGPILFLYLVKILINPGVLAASLAAIAVTSLTVIPVHVLTRRLYGQRIAAITTGLYVVAPSLVLYGATSMDGVYTLPLILTLYTFFRAVEAIRTKAAVAWSCMSGLLLATSMLMTFSTVCLVTILALYGGIAFFGLRPWRRIWAVLFLTAATFVLAFIALYAATGYDVVASVMASMTSDAELMGPRHRALLPYLDVSLANFLAFAVGAGVVTSVLWAKQIKATFSNLSRQQAVDPLLLAFAVAVPLLAVSTLFRWETERIWVFLTPLVLIAAAKQIAHAPEPSGTRKLLDFTLCALFAQTYLMQVFFYTLW